jgi:parallel beta-helix repeat protein
MPSIYYVSSTGSNTNTGLSLATTLLTIQAAITKAVTGDTIYVGSAVYNEALTINQSGISILPLPNNLPIIDGGSSLPNVDNGSLVTINGDNNLFTGFEVRNANTSLSHVGGSGIQVLGTNNTITHNTVHDISNQAILVNGDNNIVEFNTIFNACLVNATQSLLNGWPSGIAVGKNESASALIPHICSGTIIRNNTVYNNWGEGIKVYQVDSCLVDSNTTYDNWTDNILLANGTNSIIRNNLVYSSTGFTTPTLNNVPISLSLNDESGVIYPSDGNKVFNNFLLNCDLNLFKYAIHGTSGLSNSTIAFNTVVNGNLVIGYGETIRNYNSSIVNNIFNGSSNMVPSNSGLTFETNCWANRPENCINSGDIIADPVLNLTGLTTPGGLTANYFKLLSNSPAISAGTVISSILTDYFGTMRNNPPTIGGYEYVASIILPPPAPIPYDPTGTLSSNLISNENHINLVSAAIFPADGPFFDTTMVVTGTMLNSDVSVPLQLYVDYIFSPLYSQVSTLIGSPIFSYIVLINPLQWSSIKLNYRAVGCANDSVLQQQIIALGNFDRLSYSIWTSLPGDTVVNEDNLTPDIMTNGKTLFLLANMIQKVSRESGLPGELIQTLVNEVTLVQDQLATLKATMDSWNTTVQQSGILTGAPGFSLTQVGGNTDIGLPNGVSLQIFTFTAVANVSNYVQVYPTPFATKVFGVFTQIPSSTNSLTQNISISPNTHTNFTYSNNTLVPLTVTVLAIGI